ncbi:hypothetical protein OROMI_024008 [Orobanche minor]
MFCGSSVLRADLADRDRMFAGARVRSCWARPLDELVQSWSIAGGAGRSRPLPSPCRAIAAAPIAVSGGRGRFLTVGDQFRSIATVF